MPAPSRLKYIAKNSILLTKLRDIISGKNNSRINDANSLEECGQTGLNETLNSLHNMYAPKYLGLTHQTMIIKGTGLYNVQGKMERFQNKLGMGEKKVRIRVKKEVKGGEKGGGEEYEKNQEIKEFKKNMTSVTEHLTVHLLTKTLQFLGNFKQKIITDLYLICEISCFSSCSACRN